MKDQEQTRRAACGGCCSFLFFFSLCFWFVFCFSFSAFSCFSSRRFVVVVYTYAFLLFFLTFLSVLLFRFRAFVIIFWHQLSFRRLPLLFYCVVLCCVVLCCVVLCCVVFKWGLLLWEPNLDIWGATNLGVKVSVSGRTPILFHKARVTMMI